MFSTFVNRIGRLMFDLVRRPILNTSLSSSSCPGIGRRIGDLSKGNTLVPVRYVTINDQTHPLTKATHLSSSVLTKFDIDIQKENRFKQMIEQSTVDLSRVRSHSNDAVEFIIVSTKSACLDSLRKESWNGIPKQNRAQAWKLLCVRSTMFILVFSLILIEFKGIFAAESRTSTRYINKKTR
jgi:hypothetical protein